MTPDEIAQWFTDLSVWEWIGVAIVVLFLLFVLRNMPDFFRYMRIRSM